MAPPSFPTASRENPVIPPDRGWLSEVAQQLDPRVRAALDVSEPGGQDVMLPSDEARTVLDAAVRELQDDPAPLRGGAAPVLGAGVVAQFLRFGPGESVNPSAPEGSKIDERR